MAATGNVQVNIGGDVSGQIAIGNNNLQIQNHGGIVNVLKPSSRSPFRKRTGPIRQRPRPFPQLLDRAQESLTIQSSIQNGISASVFGEGGIGKTTFLSHMAYLPEADKFPHGVVYLYVKDQGLDDLLQMLFDTFYSSARDVMPTAGQLRHRLQSIQAVILLDDLMLTREDAQALIAIMPLSCFIISSLQRSLWGDGTVILLEGLPEEQQVELFAREIGRPLSEAEKTDALIICYHLRGHPLKIIQAAALVTSSAKTVSEIKKQFQTGTSPLDIPRALLNRLNESQRRVLALLGACGGALIPLGVFSSLLKLSGAQEVIRGLVNMGLVWSEGSRYGLAGPLVGQIEKIWNLSSWEDALINYFTNWLAQKPKDAFIEEASDMLVQVIQKAGEKGRWREAINLGRGLEQILILNRRWQKWLDVLSWILKAAKVYGDRSSEAWALHQLGTRAMCLNHAEQARQFLTQALEIRLAIGDTAGVAVTQHNLNVLLGPAVAPPGPRAPRVNNEIGRYLTYGFGSMAGLGLLVLFGWLLWNNLPPFPTPPPSLVPTAIPVFTVMPTSTPIIVSATSTSTPTETGTPTYTLTASTTYTFTPSTTPSLTPSRTPTKTLTLTVTPDKVGPPAPVILGPAYDVYHADTNTYDVRCSEDDIEILLDWSPVSDPSGITSYTVGLYELNSDQKWISVRIWNNLGDIKLDVNPQTICGAKYLWRVRAWDGAGNAGSWSERIFETVYVIP